MNSKQDMFRVVTKTGEPANFRNNRRKNFYTSKEAAQRAVTIFNNITVIKNGEGVQLPDAPFSIQEGQVTWQ